MQTYKTKSFSKYQHRLIAAVIVLLILGWLSVQIVIVRRFNTMLTYQEDGINKLSAQVVALQRGNPNVLHDCLNKAISDYTTSIKTNSDVNASSGQPEYVQNYDDWKKANDKLEADKAQCHYLHGD